jgi:hypothetical protein
MMPRKTPFRNLKEEREYWASADLSADAARAAREDTKMVTTLYLGRDQHRAMNALARLTHESAASLYRRAVLEFLRREARKAGTTLDALVGGKAS